jgi:hypothetical protein
VKLHELLEWAIAIALLLAVLFFSGCAHPAKHQYPPNIRIVHYKDCREVSVDAKTKQVTLVCPALQ